MARCDRTDCELGDVDDQGFCVVCGRAPLRAPARPAGLDVNGPARPPRAGREPTAAQARRQTQSRAEPWWGLALIEPGAAPPPEPPAVAPPLVPDDQRRCPNGHPVRRDTGYCPRCRAGYDFTRPSPFQVIADRYDVYRKVGEGGFGSALLAYDRNLGTDVVLKDLARSVAPTALRERDALVGLRHDSIVRIYGYEAEGPFLVLEYVPGTPLSALEDDRLEVILGHGLQILQALDYLHARGLLHMDVKPGNIIRLREPGADGPRDRVRLIDFGAVREIRREGPAEAFTAVFAPPASDPQHQQPAAGFDLYCLGATLEELCRRHLREPDAPGVAALDRLIRRATDLRAPGRRFTSARQFAEQLSGVIRQVVAGAPGGPRITRPSAVFGPVTDQLEGGLVTPRPLSHWTGSTMAADGPLVLPAPFAVPTSVSVVAALPVPLADPDDPALTEGRESSLIACRAALRRGDPGAARGALAEAGLPAWSWVRSWYSGLVSLAGGDAPAAAGDFGAVRDALPGELVPLLALGLCAEISGDLEQARLCYQAVAETAPAACPASFGLARVLLLAGRREDAVAVAGRLAAELVAGGLRFERDARVAVVRLLVAVTESGVPAQRDLARAQELAEDFWADPDLKIRLDSEIQYARSRITGDWLALSEQVRLLALRLAGTERDYYALVDLANRLRPPVRWWHRSDRTARQASAVALT